MSRKTFLRPLAVGAVVLTLSTTLTGCFNDPPKASPRTTVTETPDPRERWSLDNLEKSAVLAAYRNYWNKVDSAENVPNNQILQYFAGIATPDQAQKLVQGEKHRRESSAPRITSRTTNPQIKQNTIATAMILDCQQLKSSNSGSANNETPIPETAGLVTDLLKSTDGTWRVVRTKSEPKSCSNPESE